MLIDVCSSLDLAYVVFLQSALVVCTRPLLTFYFFAVQDYNVSESPCTGLIAGQAWKLFLVLIRAVLTRMCSSSTPTWSAMPVSSLLALHCTLCPSIQMCVHYCTLYPVCLTWSTAKSRGRLARQASLALCSTWSRIGQCSVCEYVNDKLKEIGVPPHAC
jgi:hypothetical protein